MLLHFCCAGGEKKNWILFVGCATPVICMGAGCARSVRAGSLNEWFWQGHGLHRLSLA